MFALIREFFFFCIILRISNIFSFLNSLGAKSHRLPLRRKYTILKKIKEHKRKVNRDLRRNPEKKRKPRTDRGVPNSCPFKEEILLDMEKLKQIKEREQEAKRAEVLARRKEFREAKLNGNRSIGNIDTMAKDAEKRDALFQKKNFECIEVQKPAETLHDNSAKAFYKEFRKVIEAADVILEVLDARDPIGTRCKTVEQAVLDAGANKRLVLLLNKAGKSKFSLCVACIPIINFCLTCVFRFGSKRKFDTVVEIPQE